MVFLSYCEFSLWSQEFTVQAIKLDLAGVFGHTNHTLFQMSYFIILRCLKDIWLHIELIVASRLANFSLLTKRQARERNTQMRSQIRQVRIHREHRFSLHQVCAMLSFSSLIFPFSISKYCDKPINHPELVAFGPVSGLRSVRELEIAANVKTGAGCRIYELLCSSVQ